jgi:DNA-binding MurR/RpiR family transcriptional regulator
LALAQERGSPRSLTYLEAQPDHTIESVSQAIFEANIQALRDTQRTLDLEVLRQVVHAILGARRVDIYATGGAGIVARELHFKCMQLGITANAFLDSQMQVMSAASVMAQDVGIGISHTGTQRHVSEALALAKSGQATTIAVTSYPGTPVAEAADIVLLTTTLAAAITYDSPTVRTAQLALVDVIYEAMLLISQDRTEEKMARVAKAISDHTTGSSPSA